ncbi:hypothetical protein TNCV_3133761 [Trichonephila clavipes]|nr:hypothetical protein TNCV_3133761 [Trichonephila clavipes]
MSSLNLSLAIVSRKKGGPQTTDHRLSSSRLFASYIPQVYKFDIKAPSSSKVVGHSFFPVAGSSMEPPILNLPDEVTFMMQAGLARDSITVDVGDLNLKSLKDLACNFVDKKFPEHNLNRLTERLILFRHDYTTTNILHPINVASEVSEGTLVEIVVSGKDPSEDIQIMPHALTVHSYKTPTFCDFCGEMLFGLVRQGLKCEGCGLNFHKRCAYKIPNNCTHTRRRRSATSLYPRSPTESLGHTTSSAASFDDTMLGGSSPSRARSPSLNMGRPVWVERELAGRIRVPHTFVVHSYTRPTVCQHCKKLLKGLIRQGLQCKDCKFNVHKKCMEKVPMDCAGEAPKEWATEAGRNGDGEPEGERESIEDESDTECEQKEQIEKANENEDNQDEDSKIPANVTSSNNIPLMRIVQSIKQMRRKGSKILKEGWMVHFTSKDNMKKRHYWRLDTKSIILFQNETTTKYYKEIPLSEILSVEPTKQQVSVESGQTYCFELRTANVDYYIGEDPDISRGWEVAIRQALMPVTAPTTITLIKDVGVCISSFLNSPARRTGIPASIHWCAKIKDEGEKLAYQLNEEAERTERPIRRLSKSRRNRRQTAGEIARHTTQATGRPISRFTVVRRLHGGGLFARRPVRCVPLTPAHRRRRSLWCREHRNWRDNEWGRVLFTDESRFSLSSDSHLERAGSRNHPSNIIERDRYGGRGVLVWGGIMLGSRTDLHIFDAGSVNGARYCNEILLPYVRLFRGAMGLQFLFMDDNAPCHRTVAAEQLLESEDIERMDWPARSPDLNTIEHVWDFLGRRLAARTLPPVTIRELRLALQDEWAAMPQQLIDTLILSMGRLCETCLAVRGDHIPY